jgi:hypothetical protein
MIHARDPLESVREMNSRDRSSGAPVRTLT